MTRKFKLTAEEKARWAPMLQTTFQAIAFDVLPILEECYGKGERNRSAGILEMTIDADRPTMYGGMTSEENRVLGRLWVDRDRETMKWLRQTLNY